MGKSEGNNSIQINAGGNVNIAGAVAIGKNASATITVLSPEQHKEITNSLQSLKTHVKHEQTIKSSEQDKIVHDIELIEEVLADGETEIDDLKTQTKPLINRLEKISEYLKRNSGIFNCTNTIVSVLGLASTIFVGA